jgi:hypothetical protein
MPQPSPQRILLQNATALTLDGGDELLTGMDILVEHGAIAAIGKIADSVRASCDRVLALNGRLVVGHPREPGVG